MADYLSLDTHALRQEQQALQQRYQKFAARGLSLDMSRGKPSPQQLDLSNGLLSITDYMDDEGVDTRNYGGLEGCSEARRLFAQWMACDADEVFVGGASSLEMMYHMIGLGWRKGFLPQAGPWMKGAKPKFLCPAPGYDRHFRITEDYGFELVTVDMTPDGPDMSAVEKWVQDETVRGIWIIPVYSNPDGYTCSAETVRRLAEMRPAAPDFRIFWDNAYGLHHFTAVEESCPNILDACRAAGCEDRPLMFMSTSKITFAGAGICAIGASRANIDLAREYIFPMTISFDKVNQLRHVRFLQSVGGVAAHMKRQAAFMAPKFKTTDDILTEELSGCGEIAFWTRPNGGYFCSLYVMDGCAARVVALCKEAGVVLTSAGAAFPYGKDPRDRHIRIAPSYPETEELALAARLLCIATRLASVEKLLAGARGE